MARRKYTQYLYDGLVEAYREDPKNHSAAGRKAGCDRRTALAAFNKGWPRRPWAPPIRDVLAQDREEIRAARQRAMEEKSRVAEDSRDKARKDSIESQKQEAILSSTCRANAMALGSMILRINNAFIPIAQAVADQMKNGQVTMTPKEAIKFMKDIAWGVRYYTETAHLTLQVERLRVGDPTDVFKLVGDNLSDEDVAEQLSSINDTLKRAKRRGFDHVNPDLIDGAHAASYPFEDELTDAGLPHSKQRVH